MPSARGNDKTAGIGFHTVSMPSAFRKQANARSSKIVGKDYPEASSGGFTPEITLDLIFTKRYIDEQM